MGCDIHVFAEKREADRWVCVPLDHKTAEALEARSYGTFAFLAGVRNYSGITPIVPPRGFPDDASAEVKHEHDVWDTDGHTHSWLTLEELLAFDLSAEMEDRRYTRKEAAGFYNGGATCEPGQGKRQTWREFLGEWFEEALQALRVAGAERLVFWFDN
jgi:hypothetical protein